MLGLGMNLHRFANGITSITGGKSIAWEDWACVAWENVNIKWEEASEPSCVGVWYKEDRKWEDVNELWESSH